MLNVLSKIWNSIKFNGYGGDLNSKYLVEKSIIKLIEPLFNVNSFELMTSIILLWATLHPETLDSFSVQLTPEDYSLIEILNEMDMVTPDSLILTLSQVIIEIQKKTKSDNLKL
jgi:hypothetical protein